VLFPGIGAAGQQKLAEARVAIVRCGAIGSMRFRSAGACRRGPVADYRSRLTWSPVISKRQALFDEADAAESLPKAIARSAQKIAAFNSDVLVKAEVADLTPVKCSCFV